MNGESLSEQTSRYIPGEMSVDLAEQVREHLRDVRAYRQIDEAPVHPVLRAMTAGSRSRSIYTRAASEAIVYLLERAEPGTDAFATISDIERGVDIPRHNVLNACWRLYQNGQLEVTDNHSYVLVSASH